MPGRTRAPAFRPRRNPGRARRRGSARAPIGRSRRILRAPGLWNAAAASRAGPRTRLPPCPAIAQAGRPAIGAGAFLSVAPVTLLPTLYGEVWGAHGRVHQDRRGAREQPQERLAHHPQAQDHHLHRRVGLRQVVDRLRHDRHRGAAPAVRELQPVRPQLPAAATPQPDADAIENTEHGDRGRPEAARRRLALHRGHDHRHLHRAAPAVLPRRQAARRATRTPSRSTTRRACAPSATGSAGSSASTPTTSSTCRKSLNEGAIQVPGLRSAWELAAVRGVGLLRQRQEAARVHRRGDGPAAPRQGPEVQDADRRPARSTRPTRASSRSSSAPTSRRDIKTLSERTPEGGRAVHSAAAVPAVHGRAAQARPRSSCRINGHNIAELSAHGGRRADRRCCGDRRAGRPGRWWRRSSSGCEHVVDIGLGYLSLDRETDTLSGGESQRDQDGQAPRQQPGRRDVHLRRAERRPAPARRAPAQRAAAASCATRATRSSSSSTTRTSSRSPTTSSTSARSAGTHGGEIVFEGTYAGLLAGRHADRPAPAAAAADQGRRRARRRGTLADPERHARNNLKNVSVDIPTGVLTVVTGVAGSGKSSLINEVFLRAASRRDRDRPVGGRRVNAAPTRRPTPASWTTSARRSPTPTRSTPALFSFNSKGACEDCKGLGVIYTDLAFLDGVKTPCEICDGRRFKDEVLALQARRQVDHRRAGDDRRRGARVLHRAARSSAKLQAMSDVGLDYLTLGQPLSTLSGGECQRIKLASELHKSGSIYVMDEPTTGLHMSDIDAPARRSSTAWSTRATRSSSSSTTWTSIRNADWIIDLGPEGGSERRRGRVQRHARPSCSRSRTRTPPRPSGNGSPSRTPACPPDPVPRPGRPPRARDMVLMSIAPCC